jgi:hypothetical protein
VEETMMSLGKSLTPNQLQPTIVPKKIVILPPTTALAERVRFRSCSSTYNAHTFFSLSYFSVFSQYSIRRTFSVVVTSLSVSTVSLTSLTAF